MKKEKRILGILFLSLMIVLLVSLIAARTPVRFGDYFGSTGSGQSGGIFGGTADIGSSAVNGIATGFGVIFKPILGPGLPNNFFFAQILLFFLIFSVILMSLRRSSIFGDKTVIYVVISLITAILAVRVIGENSEIFTAVLLPTGVFGAALGIFLPILFWGLLLHNLVQGSVNRRIGWVVFAFTYGLFLYYWHNPATVMMSIIAWVAIILSIIFDKTIHAYIRSGEHRKILIEMLEKKELDVLDQIDKAIHLGKEGKKKRLEKRLKKIQKQLAHNY